jgi:hypothetical protein
MEQFEETTEEFTVKIASTFEESTELLKVDFEYVEKLMENRCSERSNEKTTKHKKERHK